LLKCNSKYYSGKAPLRLHADSHTQLPHVTIQMPVYREGLHGVIKPTVQSIKRAIATYELQGGTANILINDDGSKSTISMQTKVIALILDSATHFI
jgi:hypothetical protein